MRLNVDGEAMVKLLHCLENPRELHMIERDDEEEEGEEMDEEMIKMMMEQVRDIARNRLKSLLR